MSRAQSTELRSRSRAKCSRCRSATTSQSKRPSCISLECESGEYSGFRHINDGKPGGWEIGNIDPAGILCNVYEADRDNFRPDIIDCQGLLILPGKTEECTMVNTKIVKRIETLNRYGKLVMILLVLAIGMIAIRRSL